MIPQILKSRIEHFFEPQLPAVACEISREMVSLVRVDPSKPNVVERFAVVPLAQGLVVPSLTKPNIASIPDLMAAIKTAVVKADIKILKMSLAIPDAAAKSTIHILDAVPPSENEKQQLLKWKLKKAVPFNVEESRLSYWERKTSDGKHTFLTVCICREVLNQFEEAFHRLGIHVGYITLSSFAAFDLLARIDFGAVQKSILFLRMGPADTSSLIMQEGRVSFFRHAERNGQEGSSVTPSSQSASTQQAQEIYDELYPCVMYYQDKLSSQPLNKIYVVCHPDPAPATFSSLSEKLQNPVEPLDFLKVFHSPQHVELKSLKNHILSPLGLAVGRY